jgi:hypothetical protein
LSELSSIINVVNLYAVAVDSHHYEIFDDIFTEDIHCDFGGGAAFEDRASLVTVFRQIHAVFDATQHFVSGHSIRLADDRAKCLSYVVGRFRRRLEQGPAVFESSGWYDDLLVRSADGWRIKERTSRMVTYTGDIRVMQAMPDIDTNYPLVALSDEAGEDRVRFFRTAECTT